MKLSFKYPKPKHQLEWIPVKKRYETRTIAEPNSIRIDIAHSHLDVDIVVMHRRPFSIRIGKGVCGRFGSLGVDLHIGFFTFEFGVTPTLQSLDFDVYLGVHSLLDNRN